MPTRQDSDNLPVYSPIKFNANRFSTAQKVLMAIAVASVIGVSLFLGIYIGNMIQAKPVTKQARQLPLTATTIKTSTVTSKPIKTSLTRPDVTSPTQTDETSATTASSSWRDQPCIAEKQCPEGFSESPVILVSLDGFRAEYLLRNFTPTLQRLRECGAHATHMRASYPSKTFPNHYSIVTGLYPESHGIIDNNMYDPEFGASFSLGSPESYKNRWWQGEPVWNTIEKQNKKAATFFWPGSDVDIQNMRPTYYEMYNGSIPYAVRVNQVLAWLDMDSADRPQFITLYLEEPDKAGHSYGPVADEVKAYISRLFAIHMFILSLRGLVLSTSLHCIRTTSDHILSSNLSPVFPFSSFCHALNCIFSTHVNERLAYADSYIELLMDGLFERGLHSCVNVIVLADHGMAPHSCQRVEFLQDYINLNNLYIYQGPNARIDLMEKSLYTPEEILHDTVCRSEHYDAYLKKDAPKRYHHANNRRISPIVIDVEEEWLVGRRRIRPLKKKIPDRTLDGIAKSQTNKTPETMTFCTGGTHGWDNRAASMHNFQMPAICNVHIDKAFTSVTDERPCVRGDVRIPPGLQPTCDAYSNARRTNVNPYGMFNPGENAPISAVNDSAIMTNMVPMYEGFIQGVWHDVHDYLSQWAQTLGPINVVTGPVFDYNIDGNYDDLSMVEFLYNDSSIPLPTHYFLVLTRCLELGSSLADCPATSIDALSFIIPHKEKMENCKLTDEYVFTHSSSLRDVERLTGLSLHPELDFYETMGYRLISRQTLWELNLPSPPPPTTPPPGKWIDQECVTQKVCPAGFETSPVIIVSLDGFRAEYLLRNFTPTFQRMRECGAHATHMQSVYPTKTFPNHYSLATGLYPESHGIIDNSMYDAAFDASFSLGSPEKNNNRWWNGEPIWNTVMKNGKTAATYFWPGSDVDIQDMRPDYFYYYDNRVPDHTRVNQMLHWLEYPANERPDFITAYFESVDGIGHNVDLDTDELNDELAYMDSVIGDLMDVFTRGGSTSVLTL
ncbi:PREDICTED: venom phosphodiesterase 2-like [Priapulus caudatus]|uniref:Venom phosphodiesterase 2-like n=1 Tax=Priapulus caudatus TaxID=37621 RepID=A0ABM1E2W6_PRICU|nr:PREDICTED: venom phosphodiesterase 2-like [Priapulus caudatus]